LLSHFFSLFSSPPPFVFQLLLYLSSESTRFFAVGHHLLSPKRSVLRRSTMPTARPPLNRGVTAPGALYTYRPNERQDWVRAQQDIPEHGYTASSHGGAGMNSYFPQMSTPRSPPSSMPQVPLVTIRGSRSPTEDQRAQPDIQVSPTAYSMVAHIGSGFHPECITISAMKGNVLVIVADRWDMEKDCRYEWLWRFDRDADMSSVHANYDAGVLRVTVRRIPGYRLGDSS